MVEIYGNINTDFFDQNLEFLTIGVFKKFKESDKDASKFMWSLYQIYHQRSQIRYLPEEERVQEVEENYYGKRLSLGNNPLVEKFKDLVYSDVYKSYLFWKEEMKMIDKSINEIKWTADNTKKKLDLLKAKAAIMKEFTIIAKELEQENMLMSAKSSNVSLSGPEQGDFF
mgnify:CR=1 FL=1